MAIILASGSPRRKELMSHITDEFTVIISDADESIPEGNSVEETVKNLALAKAQAVKNKCKETDIIISADTVVAYDNKILGKPCDEKEAYEMLKSLSGRTHAVYTGVCITKGDKTTRSMPLDPIDASTAYWAGYAAAKAAVQVEAGVSWSNPAQYYAMVRYWARATIDGEEVGTASGTDSRNISGYV